MKKLKPPKKAPPSDPIGDELDIEMLLAAAEAHPASETMPDGASDTLGSEAPKMPKELLNGF